MNFEKLKEGLIVLLMVAGLVLWYIWGNNLEADPVLTTSILEDFPNSNDNCVTLKTEKYIKDKPIAQLFMSSDKDMKKVAGKCIQSIVKDFDIDKKFGSGGSELILTIFYGTITNAFSKEEEEKYFKKGFNKEIFINASKNWSKQDYKEYSTCYSLTIDNLTKKLPISQEVVSKCGNGVMKYILEEQTGFRRIFY